MSLFLDVKYVGQLTPQFEKIVRKSDYLYNCRCPICGDSKKNKSKMRGYIYRKGNDLFYRCHNCQAGMTVAGLLKQLNAGLYKQYILERYSSGEGGKTSYKEPVFNIPSPKFDKVEKVKTLEHAEWCDNLPEGHFCVEYITRRKIPKKYWKSLLFTSNYKAFVDALVPNHGKTLAEDARLIVPFYDEYNDMIAVTGRALETNDKTIRYITIRTVESDKKLLYGMDRVDLKKQVRVLEGQFDSLFVENAIASCDANLAGAAKELGDVDKILIFDNEPRNKEVVNLMQVAINKGFNIVIWPDTITQKDVNEMIQSGISKKEIESIISNNTYSSIAAQTKFIYWKKI